MALTLKNALMRIRIARDFHADFGSYPEAPAGPGVDQCFDDWAADLADEALAGRADELAADRREIGGTRGDPHR